MTLKRLWRVTALICFSVILSSLGPAFSQDCDIAIFNGRVMDPESNFDAVRNVCVKTGRITRFTEDEINSEEIIQARGHVVSPGFIDTQAHSHRNLFGVKFLLRDGVTSPMELEYGNINVDAWYKAREGKWPVNFAAAAAHEPHRMRVFDKMPPRIRTARNLAGMTLM